MTYTERDYELMHYKRGMDNNGLAAMVNRERYETLENIIEQCITTNSIDAIAVMSMQYNEYQHDKKLRVYPVQL